MIKKKSINDFINKYTYISYKKVPEIKQISLNFGCTDSSLKLLAPTFLALELLSNKKINFSQARKPNIMLKIKKGDPTGCSVVLKKKESEIFLKGIFVNVLPNTKVFRKFSMPKKVESKGFSFSLNELFNFPELNQRFFFFKRVPPLNVNIVTSAKSIGELKFLLSIKKVPLNI